MGFFYPIWLWGSAWRPLRAAGGNLFGSFLNKSKKDTYNDDWDGLFPTFHMKRKEQKLVITQLCYNLIRNKSQNQKQKTTE